MSKPYILADIRDEEREELLRHLIDVANETEFCYTSFDEGSEGWRIGIKKRNDAQMDVQRVEDTERPVTLRELARYIRAIGKMPRCAFNDRELEEVLAFLDRMKEVVRRTRLKAQVRATTPETADGCQ